MRFQRLLAVDNDGVRTAPKVALHARAHQPVYRALRPKNDSKGRRESGASAASAALISTLALGRTARDSYFKSGNRLLARESSQLDRGCLTLSSNVMAVRLLGLSVRPELGGSRARATTDGGRSHGR